MQNKSHMHPCARYADLVRGQEYFTWQAAAGKKGAVYNLRFFAPFILQDQDVLEFGCGGGYLLAALHCREKVGVEINPVARAEATKNGIETLSTLQELAGRTFDTVISSHCLEHVANPYESLCMLRQLLRKDGKLILLLPVDDWRSEPWIGPDNNAHLYAWTPRLLGNLLVASGFQPVSIKAINHAWPPRFDARIWNFSRTMFDVLAYVFSIALRRRQLWAVARAGTFAIH
jgi:SAM-dependent methyltransferase